jgi:uncharacterized protein
MMAIDQLKGKQYINLETFRKNGMGVRTPVWFVQEGDTLFIRTDANSGKVKRIRSTGQVNIAACKMDGSLLGDWFSAQARQITDNDTAQKVDRLLDRKYGLMKKMFGLARIVQGRKYTVLEVKERDIL